jgi:heme-degrading monooxygenase HmoA
MVITVLEALVAPEKAAALEATYQEATKNLDAGIVQTFLLRAVREPVKWQIVTIWESRAALDAMRQSGETPRGVLMFRSVQAEPTLFVYDIVAQAAVG